MNTVNFVAVDKAPLKTGWDKRHNEAMQTPRGFEVGIVWMLRAMNEYAKTYKERFGQDWHEDYVLNTGLISLAEGVRILLNGETGRLDCGTIDAGLVAILRACGQTI